MTQYLCTIDNVEAHADELRLSAAVAFDRQDIAGPDSSAEILPLGRARLALVDDDGTSLRDAPVAQ